MRWPFALVAVSFTYNVFSIWSKCFWEIPERWEAWDKQTSSCSVWRESEGIQTLSEFRVRCSYFRQEFPFTCRIRDSCLGLWMLHASFGFRARYRSALHLSQPVSKLSAQQVSKLSAQPVSKWTHYLSSVTNWASLFRSRRLASKRAGQLQNGLSCKSGLDIYTWGPWTRCCSHVLRGRTL